MDKEFVIILVLYIYKLVFGFMVTVFVSERDQVFILWWNVQPGDGNGPGL